MFEINLDEYKIYRSIIIIDIKSFYASVECTLRGIDPFKVALVVADKERGSNSVVMSVTPYLKTFGVKNVCRIKDLPRDIEIIYAKPRMRVYLDYSRKIIDIFLSFIAREDLHVYSVDESFLDLTDYLNYYHEDSLGLAKKIMKKILDELGLYSSCGIGDNMLLAKLALDIESKKNSDFIAKWTYSDVKEKLWIIENLSKMWSIGSRMENNLRAIGIRKLGDIATNYTPIELGEIFGVIGEELWFHVNGIDMSIIKNNKKSKDSRKSFGNSQVLFRDYNKEEIVLIILEIIDTIVSRLRLENKLCAGVSLYIGYSSFDYTDSNNYLSGSLKLDYPTNLSSKIFEEIMLIFNKKIVDKPIRRVGISLYNIIDDESFRSFSLFDDESRLKKEELVSKSLDEIVKMYGNNSINRASSYLKSSTVRERNKLIGGHNADY
jgi:DNA polymerase V